VPPFGRNIGELTHPQWGRAADAPVIGAAEIIIAAANPIIVMRITVRLLIGGAPQSLSMKLNGSDAVAACDAPLPAVLLSLTSGARWPSGGAGRCELTDVEVPARRGWCLRYAITRCRTAISRRGSVANSLAAASIAASALAALTLPIHLALPSER
jgi:hypothetical protein